jgi:hypothetical protein
MVTNTTQRYETGTQRRCTLRQRLGARAGRHWNVVGFYEFCAIASPASNGVIFSAEHSPRSAGSNELPAETVLQGP